MPLSVFCQILSYIGMLLELCFPMLTALFVDYFLNYDGMGVKSGNWFSFLVHDFDNRDPWRVFFNITLVFTAFLLTREIVIYFRNFLFQRMGIQFENEMRKITYKKLVELDSGTVASYNTGDLLATLNSDVIIFKDLYARTLNLLADSFFFLIVVSVILGLNSLYLLLIPAIIAPILLFTLSKYMKQARRVSMRIRDCNANMNLTVQENINAVRLVRSFANESLERNKFDAVNNNVREAFYDQVNVSAKYGMLFNLIRQLAYISTIAIGTILVIKGVFLVGIMTACITYVLKIMDHLIQISTYMYQLQYGLVSGGRIMEFFERETKIPVSSHPEKVGKRPDIELKDVTIIADGKQLLKNASVKIPFGMKVGLMGGTGCGKSVLLKSLVRIYDATHGQIFVDGKDVKDCELDELREDFAYVFQDVFLFSNTIDANIAFYSPNISKERILKVAEQAQASKFIKGLPQGYETIVGEKGLGLSGGQKQRISIARALLKNAPVLVLDDASSALDLNTERKLMKSIKENYPDRTILIAAHRVTSVIDCDLILYMQDGEIIERGTFEELMAQNGRFAEIYRMQMTEGQIDETAAVADATVNTETGE